MAISEFALIVGAQKCGTTSLFKYLAQHPQIAPSMPKEIYYFSHDEHYKKGWDWYTSHWNWNPDVHKIAMEASPSYTAMPRGRHTIERIDAQDENFRFIYILRNPVERIESQYAHEVLRGRGRVEGATIPPDWIALSRYATQIRAYYDRFPTDRILLLHFEDIKEDPDGLVRRVCRFLDVDDQYPFTGLDTPHNVSRRDHPFYTRLTRNFAVRAIAMLAPMTLKQRVRNSMSKALDVDVKLTAEQHEHVMRELTDEVSSLRDDYGFDTSVWKLDAMRR